MNGEMLYNVYERVNAEENCGTDHWTDLTDQERLVWHRTAALVHAWYET